MIKIDPEFRDIIPPLDNEERDRLEASLIEEGGARDRLIVWDQEGILLDGHNRFEICTRRGLPYEIERRPFNTRADALAWVIRNQLGRRNLTPYDRVRLALRIKPAVAEMARENMSAGGRKVGPVGPTLNTAAELARFAGVGRNTVNRVSAIEERAPDPVREAARTGQISITRAYDLTVALEKAPPEVVDVVSQYGIDDPEKVMILTRLYKSQLEEDSDHTFDEIAATGFIQPGDEDQAVHINGALVDIYRALKLKARAHADAKRLEGLINRPPLPEGQFDLIYADPPWEHTHPISDSRKVTNHYPTMALEDIINLPVWELAAPDCTLLLWTTASKIADAVHVIEAWGFDVRSSMVWDKGMIGPGYYARIRHEILIIAVKGKPGVPEPSNRPDSIIRESRTNTHSEKPKLYRLIEQMYPFARRKIELFARDVPDGWHVWGNDPKLKALPQEKIA